MTAEEYQTELEAQRLQQRKRRKRRKRRRGMIILLFLTVCISIIAGLFYAPFFNIKLAYSVGQETLTEEDILKVAAVPVGANIFQTNVSELKRRVASIPYVENSNVRRVFPNKIKIWVRECQPAAYIQLNDQFVVINTDGRVLEVREDNGAYALPLLCGMELTEAVPGTNLRQSVGTDKFDTTMKVLSDLKEAELLRRTNEIDVSKLKDIKIRLENRIELIVGGYDSFAYKLSMVNKIMKDNISAYEKAVFDFRGDKLYVRPPDDEPKETNETQPEDAPTEVLTPEEAPDAVG